jgi:hypothetical protein
MIFGLNDRWVPQDSCVGRASSSNNFSQRERPTFEIGSSFSWWWFESKTIGVCLIASRRPIGTREIPFSRSNYRRWDMGRPWHEVSGSLASGWRRTTSPCQKDNCKRKCMLIVYWGIHGITHYWWFPKDSVLNSPFVKECFVHSLRKCSQIPKNS